MEKNEFKIPITIIEEEIRKRKEWMSKDKLYYGSCKELKKATYILGKLQSGELKINGKCKNCKWRGKTLCNHPRGDAVYNDWGCLLWELKPVERLRKEIGE